MQLLMLSCNRADNDDVYVVFAAKCYKPFQNRPLESAKT